MLIVWRIFFPFCPCFCLSSLFTTKTFTPSPSLPPPPQAWCRKGVGFLLLHQNLITALDLDSIKVWAGYKCDDGYFLPCEVSALHGLTGITFSPYACLFQKNMDRITSQFFNPARNSAPCKYHQYSLLQIEEKWFLHALCFWQSGDSLLGSILVGAVLWE